MNIVFFEKSAYSFEALRALGAATFGGGEVGEVLTALERIKEGDDEGWYASWKKYGRPSRGSRRPISLKKAME